MAEPDCRHETLTFASDGYHVRCMSGCGQVWAAIYDTETYGGFGLMPNAARDLKYPDDIRTKPNVLDHIAEIT
jgi:hypothetical protein